MNLLLALFLFLLVMFGVSIILSIPTYLLWNWLMPVIFGLPEITLMQALGISLLCSILFKSPTKISGE